MSDQDHVASSPAAALLAEAEACLQAGDDEGASRSLLKAAEVAKARGEPETEIRSRLGLASILRRALRPSDAVTQLERVAAVAGAHGDRSGLLVAASQLGSLYMELGSWQRALDSARATRDLARLAKDRRTEAASLGLAGQVLRRLGDLDASLESALEGLAIAQADGDLSEELAFLADLALLSLRRREVERAGELATRGLVLSRGADRHEHATVFLGQLGEVARARGEWTRARSLAEEGIAAAREQGNRREEAVFEHDLALVAEAEGRLEEALQDLERSVALLEEVGNAEGALAGSRRRAQLLVSLGRGDEGYAVLAEALRRTMAMDARAFEETFVTVFELAARSHRGRGWDSLARGVHRMDEVIRDLEDQGRLVDTMAGTLREALEVLALVSEAGGDPDAPEIAEARELATRVEERLGIGLTDYLAALLGGSDG